MGAEYRDDLALRALGEPASPDLEQRLRDDLALQQELDAWRSITDAARSLSDADRILEPAPARLWRRIEAEIAGSSGADDQRASPPRALDTAPGATAPWEPTADDQPSVNGAGNGVLHPPRGHWTQGLLAVAAALAAAAVLGAALLGNWDPSQPDPVAVAALEPLDTRATPTQARLVPDDGGGMALHLDGGDLPDAQGYYALWLLNADATGMVALGPLDTASGHRLPVGIDLDEYPVVDVSLEPFDGDPTHSGDSLLRGALDTGG